MNKTTYLASWMEGTLSDLELEQIEGKTALNRYKKIKEVAAQLRVNDSESLAWEHFSQQLSEKIPVQKKSTNWIYSLAAGFAILVGIGSFLLSQKQYLATDSFSQIELADGSGVALAPGATLQHRRSFNLFNRTLQMEGEAFFEVEKGKPFRVNTPNGRVEVVGTAFKVISTAGFFKVVCTEGIVKVSQEGNSYVLNKGYSYDSTDQMIKKVDLSPYKNNSTNYYNSVPLDYIVQLVSTIYGITIELNSIKNNYFTGLLPLDDREKALKSISLPFSFKVVEQRANEYLLMGE
jgi:transmembrane sensor